jgi:hypothetical protein
VAFTASCPSVRSAMPNKPLVPTGCVIYTDHGNLAKPLAHFASVPEYVASRNVRSEVRVEPGQLNKLLQATCEDARVTCSADFTFAEGFGGDVQLTRTQTIMQGADHCDFRYKLNQRKQD